ncbi:MAG: Phosphoenolpyruvate synthase [Candidatus Magasanikbacteria bacterium GW2011_GWA2_56_11]|uniref:Phosphoenolpyruvate synthase n=1 Tax=Candidatus Magasanikbacteria bacterium GW2011_GWA2_56_11 TaxID=1619044 RepID=A0A0G1YEL8_9BACT|nr:MAG: Phosphoenolpyruvate synthase [Candidatus Magasanikbacteria bacterium GW2011_GWA2_56_11]
MEHLKFFSEISKGNVDIAGGKGASLGEMTQAGLAVPPGFVVLSSAFDRFIEETHLNGEIIARLAAVNPADTNSVDRASNALRGVIHDTSMPEDLKADILGAYKKLGAEYVAVRSSATAEDSSVASWAGELETYLNTTEADLLERVRRCWSSLFTPRAIFYRHEKDLISAHVSVAVVVQKMIQSEISGIAFTVHPVTEDRDQMIIEAGYGLGEAIVSGQITPDSYVVSKGEMSILDISIGHQTRKLEKMAAAGVSANKDEENPSNAWVDLGEAGERQKLTGRQIMELAALCKKIEDHYGFPCDIEWAYEGGQFYITQSRPITTLKT